MPELTPNQVGALITMHLDAKEKNSDIDIFYCKICKTYYPFEDMAEIDCYCCGWGTCNLCKYTKKKGVD